MYAGDSSRKETLVEHGFRLPSAKDNRPLKFNEFLERVGPMIYTSATPADYERKGSQQIVEQVIRPTGLVDPEVEIRPIREGKLSNKSVSQQNEPDFGIGRGKDMSPVSLLKSDENFVTSQKSSKGIPVAPPPIKVRSSTS